MNEFEMTRTRPVGIVQRVKRLFGIAPAVEANDGETASNMSAEMKDALALLRIVEERSRTLEKQLNGSMSLVHVNQERLGTIEKQLDESLPLLRISEERSRSLERQLHDSLTLLRITEERSRSQQYQSMQALYAADYQMDMLQKWYVESAPSITRLADSQAAFGARSIRLETAYPIALTSNDHLVPGSTAEGVVRPTQFVTDCVRVLGRDMQCLDLGTGAAGLVFEFAMNDIVAIGVDGSDYCRNNKVGYWPLLPDNLRTCDITHPFRFKPANDEDTLRFDLITTWEVLEHIAETDLAQLLQNVKAHLAPTGYFIGSVSLLEYVAANGHPYHVTLKSKSWWKDKFQENGLLMLDEHPFNERLFYRGNGPRFQDFHNYFSHPEEGFHFVARRIQLDAESGGARN
jgi:SAM-dependent methyltransferase